MENLILQSHLAQIFYNLVFVLGVMIVPVKVSLYHEIKEIFIDQKLFLNKAVNAIIIIFFLFNMHPGLVLLFIC